MWQKCPICDGEGRVTCNGATSSIHQVCSLCKGTKIISELNGLPPNNPIELPSDEELAILFHNKYEELAPKFKYETKIETKKFNKDSNNGKLMIAVCKQILEILNQNK